MPQDETKERLIAMIGSANLSALEKTLATIYRNRCYKEKAEIAAKINERMLKAVKEIGEVVR
jgi:hypothetical protein